MPKIIAVDFDNTLSIGARFPDIGQPNMPLIRFLLTEQQNGAKLILWSCRVGQDLDRAVEWCRGVGLIFDTVNENIPEMIERFGNDSRKVYAHIYIDDASIRPEMLIASEQREPKHKTEKHTTRSTAILL